MQKVMITIAKYYNNNLLLIVHELFHAHYLHRVYMYFVIRNIAVLIHFSLTSHLSDMFYIGVILNNKEFLPASYCKPHC